MGIEEAILRQVETKKGAFDGVEMKVRNDLRAIIRMELRRIGNDVNEWA